MTSLALSHRDGSNEGSQHMFLLRNKKNYLRTFLKIPPFSGALSQVVGYRTASWNYMNNTDKQTLLREMKPLEPIAEKFTDILQQKRLQTLQSVDSLVEKVS